MNTNSPLSNENLLENLGNIVKASNADVYADQVLKLKKCNKELIEGLIELISLNEQISQNFNFPAIKKAKALIKKAKLI